MTLHRSFFTVLMAALGVAIVVMLGCSSDDDDEEIVAPEDEPVVDLEPSMGWDGGRNIRITVGGKTQKEVYDELYDKQLLIPWFRVYRKIGKWRRAMEWEGRFLYRYYPFAHSQYFSFSEEEYTIDVTVLSMLEAGMEEPATIEEIRARYRELGYRPMTAEEVFYLRLQFTDQPPLGSGHPLGEFFALMEDNSVERYGPYLLGLVHSSDMLQKFIVKRFVGSTIPNSFDPHFQEVWIETVFELRHGADFACVKIQ